jgi:uncharacterized protein DUF1801
MKSFTFNNPQVEAVFLNYPKKTRQKLLYIRELIFKTANEAQGVGRVEETLKWGQPSYLTPETKSGSTIRIDQLKSDKEMYAIYFHCQTTLVDSFRELYSNIFKFEGNRCILFSIEDDVPEEELGHCLFLALTYHLSKKQRSF